TLVGFAYIGELMRRPGEHIFAEDLLRSISNGSKGVTVAEAEANDIRQDTSSGDRDGMAALDEKAIKAFRDEIEKLKAQENEELEFGRHDAAEAKRQEWVKIASYTALQIGKAGRSRRIGSEGEKARQSVTQAIKRAIREIATENPDAANWLKRRV